MPPPRAGLESRRWPLRRNTAFEDVHKG